MKSSLILFIVLLDFHSANSSKFEEVKKRSNRFRPFMLFENEDSPILEDINLEDDESLRSVLETILCPVEKMADQWIIEKAAKNYYPMKYCLFQQNLETSEDLKCAFKIEPVLKELTSNGKVWKCGNSDQYSQYGHSYMNCGTMDNLDNLTKSKTHMNFTYKICYDGEQKQAIWTSHTLRTPPLLKNPTLKNQEIAQQTAISKASYFIGDDFFTFLENEYKSEQQKKKSHSDALIMVPQPLVPPEHMAFWVQKMTTHHYINMAPLWEKLVPLMRVINEGIKKLEFRSPGLKIYTTVATIGKRDESEPYWHYVSIFDKSIWYKFVYQLHREYGVLIVIHNTPEKPPSKGCVVGKEKKCNFKLWTKNEKIQTNIELFGKSYAFCCKVKRKHILDIFQLRFNVGKYLDIDDLIVEKQKEAPAEFKEDSKKGTTINVPFMHPEEKKKGS